MVYISVQIKFNRAHRSYLLAVKVLFKKLPFSLQQHYSLATALCHPKEETFTLEMSKKLGKNCPKFSWDAVSGQKKQGDNTYLPCI